MKVKLNNPVPLLSIALLGVGVEVLYSRNPQGDHQICLTGEAIVWEGSKEWTVKKAK